MRTAIGLLVILLALSCAAPAGACVNDGDSGRYEKDQQYRYDFVGRLIGTQWGGQWGVKEWGVTSVGLLGAILGAWQAVRLGKQAMDG